MNEIFRKIILDKKIQVEKLKKITNINLLMQKANDRKIKRNFAKILANAQKQQKTAVIAEIKYKSPAKFIAGTKLEPDVIAQKYQNAGAVAVSVLTDQKYFGGKIHYLQQVRDKCHIPVLQKDFIIDNYQIVQAKALGADAILVIMAALDDAQAQELEKTAIQYQLDVIIEIHSKKELFRVFEKMNGTIIGINNRNLQNFSVSINNSIEIAKDIDKKYTIISESGIKNRNDIKILQDNGIYCFLIGQTFMQKNDPGEELRKILHNSNDTI